MVKHGYVKALLRGTSRVANFENVYFALLILTSLRFISKKLPILGPVPENMQNRQFFAHKSQSSQNKYKKVYIFEISIKFGVD